MRKPFFLILVCVLWAFGCSESSTTEMRWFNEREYTLKQYSDNGKLVMKAEIVYLGKSPQTDKIIAHDWQAKSTDFYKVIFTNVSGADVEIKKVEYFMEIGPLRTPKYRDQTEIREKYGTVVLTPNQTITHVDAYIWAVKGNVLHRKFYLETIDGLVVMDLPLVFEFGK